MKEFPKLLIANKNGEIFDLPQVEAVGMKNGAFFRIDREELVPLHPDSELFMLPARSPIGYNHTKKDFQEIKYNPFKPTNEECYAVAAFVSPGYTITHNVAYKKKVKTSSLPLFSYSAVVLYKNKFYVTAVCVDREKRQDLSRMDIKRVQKNVENFRKILPNNRLARHLEKCALIYGCPAGKNFFLKRYECPLPTSPKCNARCVGCISFQENEGCPVTQPRITFTPTAKEIAEVALFHIKDVDDPIVSFGQGCEGEPLMVGEVIGEAIELIRNKTQKGIINMNTNASRPEVLKKLFDKGLDSIRVSMNSVRETYYNRYYRPVKYSFEDVKKSIKYANKKGKFVSLNYLVMPGFTDSISETKALFSFLEKNKIDMIQWRNMNYDPEDYFNILKLTSSPEEMVGMDKLIAETYKKFPHMMKGYFNPSKKRIYRFKKSRLRYEK